MATPPSSQVNIRLSETDNIWLLDIASTWLDDNTEEAELQRLKNEQYREVSLYQHQQNVEGEYNIHVHTSLSVEYRST